MQSQQNEALQEIKEEIKITNSGFTREISQLRDELDEVKAKLSGHEARWAELEDFKRDILEEFKKQLDSQATEVAQEVKQSFADDVSKQIADQNSQFAEKIKDDVSKQVTDQNSQFAEKMRDERQDFRDDLVEKSDEDLAKFSHDIRRDFLKEKCFNRRFNLILLGLQEAEEEGDEKERVSTLLKNRLSIPTPKIDSVYRLGVKSESEGKRPRPVMISFSKWYSRCAVWFAKGKLNKDQDDKLRLQEDLPTELRWELNILLKILRQAKSMPEAYPKVRIKDYKIIMNGVAYGVEDQDILPPDLQLFAIATPQSDEAIAFFGRDSPFF